MPKEKKSTYSRPEGWEKTIKRSYWDQNKAYTDVSDEEKKAAEEEERKKKAEEAGKGKYFGKLLKKMISG